jgi:hypothetical protein
MAVDSKQIPITSPCPIDLDQSEVGSSDRRMFCAHCDKNVHLLSHMTEDEARNFMQAHAGENICVSYNVGRDGEIRFFDDSPVVTADEIIQLAPKRADIVPTARLLRRVRNFPAAASLGMLLAACAPHGEPDQVQMHTQTTETLQVTDRLIPIADEPFEDEPCISEEQVDGGIEAVPIVEPTVPKPGGLQAAPIDPPPKTPMRRGRVKLH